MVRSPPWRPLSISLRYFNACVAADASIGEIWEQTYNLILLVIAAALGRRGPVKVFGMDYLTPGRHGHPRLRPRRRLGHCPPARPRPSRNQAAPSDAVNLGSGTGSSVNEVPAVTAAVSGKPSTSTPLVSPATPTAVVADNTYAKRCSLATFTTIWI